MRRPTSVVADRFTFCKVRRTFRSLYLKRDQLANPHFPIETRLLFDFIPIYASVKMSRFSSSLPAIFGSLSSMVLTLSQLFGGDKTSFMVFKM